MKKALSPILLAGLGLLIVAGAAAAADIKLGAHAGISIPNLRGSDDDIFSKNFESRKGPYFGLTADIGLARRFSLGLDLNYTSQGGIRNGMQPITLPPDGLPLPPGTILYADFRNETVLDYVELPVLARYTFGGKIRFFVDAGPYLGYLVRAKAFTEGVSPVYLDEGGAMPVMLPPDYTEPLVADLGAETDVKDSLAPFNFGVAGGGGVAAPLGPGDLVLEARFQLGLTRLQRDPADGNTQTGVVVVSLGYLLPLGGHK